MHMRSPARVRLTESSAGMSTKYLHGRAGKREGQAEAGNEPSVDKWKAQWCLHRRDGQGAATDGKAG